MNFILIADDGKQAPRFFPFWEILVFSLAVILMLAVMFPNRLLEKSLANTQATEINISYLQSFKRQNPNNLPLQLTLIKQQIEIGKIDDAFRSLALLQKTKQLEGQAVEDQIRWMHYLALRYKANELDSKMSTRIAYLHKLKKLSMVLADSKLSNAEMKTLAKDNLAIGQTATALKIYEKLDAKQQLHSAKEYAEAASIASQVNAQKQSSDWYWKAYQRSEGFEKRREYAMSAIKALWASNDVNAALAMADHVPSSLFMDHESLLFLSRLALSANRPDLAQNYALRALEHHAENKYE